jgi:hypothetical protein
MVPGGFVTGDPTALLPTGYSAAAFYCDIPYVYTLDPFATTGCQFSGIVAVASPLIAYFGVWRTTVGTLLQGPLAFGGTSFVQNAAPLSYGFPLGNLGFNQHSNSGGIAIFDQAQTFLVFDQRMAARITGKLWGSNNTGAVASVNNGAQLYFSLQGAGFTILTTSNGNGAYSAGQYDFLVGGKSNLRPVDDTTDALIATGQDATYAKLLAATSANGFGKSIRDHKSQARVLSA